MGCNFDGMLLNNEVDLDTFFHCIPALVFWIPQLLCLLGTHLLRKMLNGPKKLNAISTKIIVAICPPVCPLPHSYFLKNKFGDTRA
jgi:hypothetical protein